jgi:Na+-transporting methylmalonyl-CoA/oxaloacetate decarboxylase gamma subunit
MIEKIMLKIFGVLVGILGVAAVLMWLSIAVYTIILIYQSTIMVLP